MELRTVHLDNRQNPLKSLTTLFFMAEVISKQPSFTSMLGTFVMKTGEVLDDIEMIPSTHLEMGQGRTTMSDDEDPYLFVLANMREINEDKWNKIGYVPPQDLFPLYRATSFEGIQKKPSKTLIKPFSQSYSTFPTIGSF